MRLRRFLNGEGPALLLVIVVCLIIGLLLDRIDRTKLDYAARDEAARIGIEVLQRVTMRLDNKAIGLGRLVTAAEMMPAFTPEEFARIAARLVEDLDAAEELTNHTTSAIMNISLARGMAIEHVYPLNGNRVFVGVDYRDLPSQIADVRATLAMPTPRVSGPFMAVQGQRAVAVRQRIMAPDGTVKGLASVAIDLDIFAAQLAARVARETPYRVGFLVDGFGNLGDSGVFRDDPLLLDLQTRDMGWTIAVLPKAGWPSLPLLTPTRVMVALIGLALLALVHATHLRNRRQRQKELRLEKGIDALSAGFVIFDRNDRLIHWNETYKELFAYGETLRRGITLQELLRAGLDKGIFRVDAESEEDWIASNVDNHRRAGGSVEVEMADGRWIKVLSRRTEDGDLVGVRFDITDLKRAQFQAEQLSNAKSEMISVMSHELRTPLTTILGFGRLLNAQPLQDDAPEAAAFRRDAISRIVCAGENLLKLINEMLDYVKLGAQGPAMAQASCNLREVIRQITTDLLSTADEKGVRLEVSTSDVDVAADPARVGQIVENLLSNAVKFTDAGGTVRVSTQVGRRFARVTVADDGVGIPADRQHGIFEEFSQLAPSGRRREGGIGLGLALTKRLVELHGGQISVTSAPGKGSAFTFSLPLQDQAA